MSGRFVDYFAVCGLDPELELDEVRVLQQRLEPNQNEEPQNHTDLLHRTFRSRVLAHFPENVEGNPFDPDAVNMLSVPGGLRFWSQPQAPRFHSFLITREDYSRTYGFVLTFSERVQTQARTQTQTLSRDQGRDQGGDQGRCSSWSLDSLLVSLGEDQVYVCKALVILAPLPFMGVYRNFLWQLHRAVTAETSPPLPLESYIYNLLYEVPLPPPGLSVQLQGVYEPVWCHRPGTAELPLLDFSVSDALLRLGPQQLLQVFSCLLLEHQVLLYSQDPQLLVVVGEVLCSLLFPFQWQHVYVPLLPAALSHFLDAPVPYLMGLQGQDRSQLDLPQEANLCFVDLDNSSVDVPEDFPQFPLQEELILELKDVLQRHSAPETSSGPGSPQPARDFQRSSPLAPLCPPPLAPLSPPPLDPLSLQDQCNGNVPSEVLDLLQKNQTLQRLEALTRRARVSVTQVKALRAGVHGPHPQQEGRGLSGRLQQEKKAAILNTQLREVFAARFVAMFCDYDAFVIHSCSDLHSWLTARENMHNFDKASFLSEQPEHLLPFLARFIETQMFASFIDNKIMSQWNQQEAQLRLFDQRIQTRRLYQQRATTYQLQQAVQAVEQRYQRVAHTAVLPHLLRMRIGQGRFTPGTFPRLQQEVLKAPTTRRTHRTTGATGATGAPSSPHTGATGPQEPGLRESLGERCSSFLLKAATCDGATPTARTPRKSASTSCLQETRTLPQLSDLSPAVIAQTNWKFVEGLLKECRLKTKRMLLSKLGREAVELGHGDTGITGIEENMQMASLCELLERIWSHGLMVKQGKSSLWSHLLHFQAREERLEQHAHESSERRRSESVNTARLALLQDMRHVQLVSEIQTDVGRSRSWIRLSLEKKTLSQHLKQLLSRHALTRRLYKRHAFLRCEEQKEQLLFHLLSLNAVDYLCFTSVYTTIMIPYRVAIVPVKRLGNSLLTSKLWVCVSGDLRDSGVRTIPKNQLETDFQCQNLGRLTTLQIGHDNTGLLSSCLVDCVLVRNQVTGHTYRFPCGRWLGSGVGDGSLERVLIAELLPPAGGEEDTAQSSPVHTHRDTHTRRVSLSSITASGIKPSSGQIQDALGEVINNMIQYFHRPEKERGSLTVHLCGEDGLVTALEQLFSHGFKSSRRFHKNIFIWDFVERACSDLGSADQTRPLGRYVEAINSSSRSVGKDGKFQLLVCLGTRDHALAQWLPLLASSPVALQLYEDWALLRDLSAVNSLSQVLMTLHQFPLRLEPSLVKGVCI